jgi:F0F1-type ATP synthase membrane subunit b/b'
MLKAIISSVLIIGLMAVTATGASASTWSRHHPRRAEVNHRLANQNKRIAQERREGELTKAQATDLRTEDRGIRGQERYDASQNGSHITKTQQRQLNREENQVGRQIGQ